MDKFEMPLTANQINFLAIYLRRRRRIRTLIAYQRPRRSRRAWSSEVFLRRELEGIEATLLPILQNDSIYKLSDFLRIEESTFNLILEKLGPRLAKNSKRKPPN